MRSEQHGRADEQHVHVRRGGVRDGALLPHGWHNMRNECQGMRREQHGRADERVHVR